MTKILVTVLCLLPLVTTAPKLKCQVAATGPVTTIGKCSPVVVQPKNSFSIKCDSTGMSAEDIRRQREQFAQILTRIRQNGISTDRVLEKLDSMSQDISDIKATTANRHLTVQQAETLKANLTPFMGKTISVTINLGDMEGLGYAEDFITVFRSVGLDGVGGSGYNQAIFSTPTVGLHLAVSPNLTQPTEMPKQCLALLNTLLDWSVIESKVERTNGIPDGSCGLIVGSK